MALGTALWLGRTTPLELVWLVQVVSQLIGCIERRAEFSPLGPRAAFSWPWVWLGARWNRLGQAVKTRKKREFSGKKWVWPKKCEQGRDHLVVAEPSIIERQPALF